MSGNITFAKRALVIAGMLFFGTCTVVVQKFLFEQTAQGRDIYGEHKFNKPWFQTNSMFIGMFLALLVYEIQQCFARRSSNTQSNFQSESVASLSETNEASGKKQATHKKMYFVVAAPACCDLLATSLMNIGLLYINASVWQMLRGSMVLFSSIFCAFILKRPHYPYMWWSVLLIVIALGVVGFASVASTGVGKAGVSTGKVVMAIFLTIGSQLIQASQIVIEEFLMHDLSASPVLIVGLEGMWGTIFTCSIFLPLTQFAFPNLPEGEGLHEDTLDTFIMISNSSILIVFVIGYVIVILAYNVMGMYVTQVTSAVIRTILEGLRTLCIWIVQLCLFYGFQGKTYGNHHPDLGEEWTKWSFMELSGFLLLFTGTLLYNRIIEVPVFKYPPKTKEEAPDQIDNAPLIPEETE